MARVSPLLLSAGAAIVLFAGTTAGILAAQGRLSALFGGADPAASQPADGEHGSDSQPAGETAGPDAAHGESASKKQGGGHDSIVKASLGNVTKDGAHWEVAKKTDSHGAEGAQGAHEQKPGNDHKPGNEHKSEHEQKPSPSSSKDPKPDAHTHGKDGAREYTNNKDTGHGAPEASGPLKATAKNEAAGGAPAHRRGATKSLVAKFTLPSPFSAEEVEGLLGDLKESREAFENAQKQNAYEKASNERDRLDLDASFAKLDEMRTTLETQKKEVSDKVAELARRADALTAGEEKFIKAEVARIKDLDQDKIRERILQFDTRLAAQILSRLEPKKQGMIIMSMPADKCAALTKALSDLAKAPDAGKTPGASKSSR